MLPQILKKGWRRDRQLHARQAKGYPDLLSGISLQPSALTDGAANQKQKPMELLRTVKFPSHLVTVESKDATACASDQGE